MLVYAPYLGNYNHLLELGLPKDVDLAIAGLDSTAAAAVGATSPLKASFGSEQKPLKAEAPSPQKPSRKINTGQPRRFKFGIPCCSAATCQVQDMPAGPPACAAKAARGAESATDSTTPGSCMVNSAHCEAQGVTAKGPAVISSGNASAGASVATITSTSSTTSTLARIAAAAAAAPAVHHGSDSARWDRLNNYVAAQTACIEYAALGFGVGHGMLPSV